MNSTIEDLGLEGEELEIVRDPYEADFRPSESEIYSFKVDESLFEEVDVDKANEIVSVTYSGHEDNEIYARVFSGENFSLVERPVEDTNNYYLVTDDGQVLMNEGEGYEKSPNVRPVQVAEAADFLYETALEAGHDTDTLEFEKERLE